VACDACWQPVESLSDAIRAEGLPLPSVVAGGSPTFAIHARARPEVELSPGTTLLWDRGYTLACPELGFLPAAALLARVISVPRPGTACLDLGTKALASEMPEPRAWFPQLGEAALLGHSEEHMLLSVPDLEVGRVLYAIPSHICPTVALHSEVVVAEGGRRTGTWKVIARDRRLSV
jgi:D-serine deaminase-like pyridoxal phosphate-dependent protein